MSYFDAFWCYCDTSKQTAREVCIAEKQIMTGGNMIQQGNTEQQLKLELTSMKRNPYLANLHDSRKQQPIRHSVSWERQHRKMKRQIQIRRQRAVVMLIGVLVILGLTYFLCLRLFDKPAVNGSSEPLSRQSKALVNVLPQELIQGIRTAAILNS